MSHCERDRRGGALENAIWEDLLARHQEVKDGGAAHGHRWLWHGEVPWSKRVCLAVQLRFVPDRAGEEGLAVQWTDNDKTLIQVDSSSLNAENASFDVMSLYRYLILLERTKKVTKYEVTYTDISRSSDGATGDGFQVKLVQPHRFKPILGDGAKTPSCKAFFADIIDKVEASLVVLAIFRFRFERVCAVSKTQKPYCILSRSLSLQAGRPIQAGVCCVLQLMPQV